MIPRAVRRAAGGALLVFFAGHGLRAARALADEATIRVTVVRPIGGDVALTEIATRAWAELNAGGVAATLIDCAAESDACDTAAASPVGGDAITLRTFRRADETITEAAFTPSGRDHPTVRRSLTVSDEAAADPKVMAIRAVELVNAMLLQVDMAAAENAAALRRAAIADAEDPGQHLMPEPPPPVDHRTHWSLGAGASFLKGPGGLSAAFGFAIRAGFPIHNRVGLSALVSETPSRTGTATLDVNLSTNQQVAAIEVTCRLYQNARVTSHLAFGGGVYHLNAAWTVAPTSLAMADAAGSPSALWALLLSGGGGVVLAIGREMSLFLEARVVLAAPNPSVSDANGHPLKTADPSLLLSLGLQRTF